MATKKQAVLKDFSALKIEKRIELSAIGIYQLVFRGEMERAFEPKKGTEIHRVYKMKRLDLRQQRAWKLFRDDIDRAAGKSGSVCSDYGEQTSQGNGSEFRVPKAFTNKAWDKISWIFRSYLSAREARLLWDLLQNDLKGTSELKLEFIGLMRSGYSGEDEARVAGTVHVQTLLDRLADLYQC
jgi:hypothetical protein